MSLIHCSHVCVLRNLYETFIYHSVLYIHISHARINIGIVIDINAAVSISITRFSCWQGEQFNRNLQDISINVARISSIRKNIKICYDYLV